ncbi:transcriptional regulator [bacterium (Candidatus Howlettbacteria) CG_4_10_14_0_8_um_filter_40_9]|nr:MAG: transcriptional regulator [bacterium (Candidatus Howlettbacteria) CG_4_10_14_0_8_um_filter_40_9]
MFEQLFGSKTRVKLLNLFLNNDEMAFYVRELTRKIDEQINSVRRELANLKSLDIVTCKKKNGKLYYMANPHMEIFPELKNMFRKIAYELSDENKLAKNLKKMGVIKYASLMGKLIKDPNNRVDLFIIGDVDKRKFQPFLKELEKDMQKELNYTILSFEEYNDRRMLFDRFITEIFSAPQEIVVNQLKD